MGWVNSGNYTLAYFADNQGNAVHVRNMGVLEKQMRLLSLCIINR